ncbi:hypothetical protein PAXINDRAFT_103900 [Paxillus involutus ATCC 200175]|uniref:G domain-containing protein n=1 Tax=Paxillus involutus ATCC 200175 TaxID=664439 RepID=A0A0C9ST50_PAXIN|nr:hypothetical protein PAXINDRAFT_103900 [Paxillus involutus ATCC 200175]
MDTPQDMDNASSEPHSSKNIPNVIIFGETGVGKSSLINLIGGQKHAETSPDAQSCTFRHTEYDAVIEGEKYRLWDTAGLDEARIESLATDQAEAHLTKLLQQLIKADGVQLLIYCVRGSRVTSALLRNYRIFYTAICRKKAPVVIVVTGLENYEGSMDEWWTVNEKELKRHQMRFQDHACVTTLAGPKTTDPLVLQHCDESRKIVCDLIRKNCRPVECVTNKEGWRKKAFADVRSLMNAKKDGERRAAPNIIIYDSAMPADDTPMLAGICMGQWPRTSCVLTIEDMPYTLYNVHNETQPEDTNHEKIHPDLLVFITDTESADTLENKLTVFHEQYQAHMCPLILVVRGQSRRQEAEEWWASVSSEGWAVDIHVVPAHFPAREPSGGTEAAAAVKELQELIAEKCLDRVVGTKQHRQATTSSFPGNLTRFWPGNATGRKAQ